MRAGHTPAKVALKRSRCDSVLVINVLGSHGVPMCGQVGHLGCCTADLLCRVATAPMLHDGRCALHPGGGPGPCWLHASTP